MALVTTSVTPVIRLTPFTGISEVQREKSGIARAEEVHTSYGLWPATGAGDNRGLIFSWDLNPDYGYILTDCSVAFISAAETFKMEATAFMEIGTDLGPGASDKERQYYQFHNEASKQDTTGTTAIGSIQSNHFNTMYPAGTDSYVMVFNIMDKPSALLYPYPGVSQIEIAVPFGEAATNRAVVAYRFYCRFLQYDVVQGYNYVVNSPIMTRG